jgi:hypothetical protein
VNGGAAMAWRSKLQSIVAASNCEAELVAAAQAVSRTQTTVLLKPSRQQAATTRRSPRLHPSPVPRSMMQVSGNANTPSSYGWYTSTLAESFTSWCVPPDCRSSHQCQAPGQPSSRTKLVSHLGWPDLRRHLLQAYPHAST